MLDWIDNLGLLQKRAGMFGFLLSLDEMAGLPPASKRVIAMEVVGQLAQSQAGLDTWERVQWHLAAMSHALSLPLEDISVLSQAVGIYTSWLDASKRPAGVKEANLPEFNERLICDLTLIFSPRKLEGKSQANAPKHVELCRQVLRTWASLTGSSSLGNVPVQTDAALAKAIILCSIGVVDFLLRLSPQVSSNYVVDEVGESALILLFEMLLRSGLYTQGIWRAFKQHYPRWMHRLPAVVQWSAISLALTQRMAKYLYGTIGSERVVYMVHQNTVSIDLDDKFLAFAWHQCLFLPGNPGDLQPAAFVRAVLGIERVIQIFHSVGITPECNEPKDYLFADGNTLLHLFGKWLFDAVSLSAPEFSDGRAQVLGILCRIFCRPQHRQPFLPIYTNQFFVALLDALSGDDLLALIFIIFNSDDLFVSGLPGVRVLVAPMIRALRRLIPVLEHPLKGPMAFQMEDLRRASYKLLCTMMGFIEHYGAILFEPVAKLAKLKNLEADVKRLVAEEAGHRYRGALKNLLVSENGTSSENLCSSMRFLVLDMLIGTLLIEGHPSNLLYLINSLVAYAQQARSNARAMASLLTRILVDMVGTARWPDSAVLLTCESLANMMGMAGDGVHHDVICGLSAAVIHACSQGNLASRLTVLTKLTETTVHWCLQYGGMVKDRESQSALLSMFAKAYSLSNGVPRQPDTPERRKRNTASVELVANQPPAPGTPELAFQEHLDAVMWRFLAGFQAANLNPNYPNTLSSFVSDGEKIKCYLLRGSVLCFREQDHRLLAMVRGANMRSQWNLSAMRGKASSKSNGEMEVDLAAPSYADAFALGLPERVKSLPNSSAQNEELIRDFFSAETSRMQEFQQLSKAFEGLHQSLMSEHNGAPKNYHRWQSLFAPAPAGLDDQLTRLFLVSLGYLLNDQRQNLLYMEDSPQLRQQLQALDSFPERQQLSFPILYLRSDRQDFTSIMDDQFAAVSVPFAAFVRGLGEIVNFNNHLGYHGGLDSTLVDAFPYYADEQVEVAFQVPSATKVSEPNDRLIELLNRNSVSILWLESVHSLLDLPANLQNDSTMLYIVVNPLSALDKVNSKAISAAQTGLFRVRIVVTAAGVGAAQGKGEANLLFGPLLDGVVVRSEALPTLVRETAISAALFFQQDASPIQKRRQFIAKLSSDAKSLRSDPVGLFQQLV